MDVYQTVGIGSDFLGYRIEEVIGRGGMGVVYRAFDLRLKRPVALKLVAPSLAQDERFRERFAREAELLIALEHPNVVPIHDAGEVDGQVYLAMRLVDGTDLASLLRTEGALDPSRTLVICAQIAAALDAAHARGLVHGDVKPSNVLLDNSQHVYLADFGLTRTLDEDGSDDRSIGTPAYLAPERLEGEPVDGRSDIYSLGCVLYECLTGEAVFPRGSRLAVGWAHLEEQPPRPSKRRVGLPEAVDPVLGRALAKEPEQRFASCGALVAAAEQALGLGGRGTLHRRRPLLLVGAIVLAVAVTGAVTATTLVHGGGKRAPTHLFAAANHLAQIDAATSKVSKVYPVGTDPVVAAGADYTVYVYSRGSGTITQVDGLRDRVVEKTPVSPPAVCCSLYTGPVLAADQSGAWFIEGGTAGRRPRLAYLPVGPLGKQHDYPLPVSFRPSGVAVAARGGAVWIVGHDPRGGAVLRIDKSNGQVTAETRFPASARVDSIAFGYGAVWVLSSAKATLYKVNPHRARVAGKPLIVAHSRATRPEILPRGHDLWVRVTGGRSPGCASRTRCSGTEYSINPRTLRTDCCGHHGPPRWEEYVAELGSLWWYDQPYGYVSRQEDDGVRPKRIKVTRSWAKNGGPCITSMTNAAGSMWVTVAPLSNPPLCRR